MSYKPLEPLAQSFFVEKPSYITRVDLYFSSKDSQLPLTLQIRKNVAGAPGPYIVPFSETVLYPSSVIVTANANVATSVSFASPVFLDTGEYSLTLGSDSSDYRLWVSELGQTDVVSNKRITEQPYVGLLFKSQNSSFYDPAQAEDIKFKLYRAKFSTNTSSTLSFTIPESERTKYLIRILEKDPLELFPNSPIMRVYHENHNMSDGSYVVLSGVSNVRIFGNVFNNFYNINASAIVNTAYPISNTTFNTYTIALPNSANVTAVTRFGGPSVSATQDLRYDLVYPVIPSITQSGKITPSIKGTNQTYSLDSSFTNLEQNDNELAYSRLLSGNASTTFNLSNAQSFIFRIGIETDNEFSSPSVDTKNLGVVLVENIINNPTYDNTNLLYDIVTVGSVQRANVTALSNTVGLLNFANASIRANARSITNGTILTVSGTNRNSGTYRVVNVLESGANIRIAALSGNITSDINNASANYTVTNGTKFVTEEASTGGSALSKYITRQIDFINESTSINLRVDVMKPADTNVKFYYKTKLIGDNELLSTKEFTEITNITIPQSLAGEFYEVQTQLDNLPPFNGLVFKIVFLSSDTSKIPKVKNLRLIALE